MSLLNGLYTSLHNDYLNLRQFSILFHFLTTTIYNHLALAGSAATFHDDEGEAISIAKWRQIPPVAGRGVAVHRFCHVGAVYNGSFYVFGGYDGSSRLNDFVKYDLALDDLYETSVPPSTLLNDLQSFFREEDFLSVSDITINVEGIPVRCHKVMLMRCRKFVHVCWVNLSSYF